MLRQQQRFAGIPRQASFIRDAFLSLLSAHADDSHSADPQLLHLLESTNAFLKESAVEPIELPEGAAVRPTFGEALVEFFNEINHYTNPMNEQGFPCNEPEREQANMALSKLYYSVSEYLHATHVPITRKGVSFMPEVKPEPFIKMWRRRVERQEDGSFQSHVEEVEGIDFSKKAVICVGGTASIHGHMPSINGLMKVAEGKLGGPEIHEEGVELYCVSYPAAHRPSFFAETHHYNADPEYYYSETARQFADTLLMPAIDKVAHPNLAQLKEVFSKVNLFAYSYGTVFVQEVRNYLSETLLEKGYDAREVKDVFAEAYAMNIGPTCRLDVVKTTGNFSSVYVLSPGDLNVRSKTHNHVFLNAMATSGKRMKPLSENELLIYSEAPETGSFIDYGVGNATPAKGSGFQASRDNPSRHDLKFYTEPSANEEGRHDPRFVGYHMSEAVGTRGMADGKGTGKLIAATAREGMDELKIGSRLVRDLYQLYVLDALAQEQSQRKR